EIRMDEGEVAVERTSEDTKEMATVLTFMDAATVLAGGIDSLTLQRNRGYKSRLMPKLLENWKSNKKGRTRERLNRLLEMQKWQGFMLRKSFRTSEEVPDKEKSPEEIPEEKVKEMMQLVPIEKVLGGSSACYQHFVDLLKHLDREDLNQLWVLVKEYLCIRPALSDNEMELWVELKRLYEPDPEDQMWAQTQNYMHAPVEWKLYDLSGVHHVTAKDKEIFMLVEKDYPLRKGLALVMITYKLQVENYSRMAEDLIWKIYNIANSP
nr:hypothetical protein [Tanacetum cinerariifolium]